jgi:AraC-like DNA-binding protein
VRQPAEARNAVRPAAALTVGEGRVQGRAMTAPSDGQPRIVSRSVPARRFPPPAEDADRLVVRYARQDYDLDTHAAAYDQLTDEQRELVNAIVPLSDAQHYRLPKMRFFERRGWMEFCGLADGFFVTFGEIEFDRAKSGYFSVPDTLQVYVASNGDGEFAFPHDAPLSFEAPNTAIVIEPAGAPATEATYTGAHRYAYVFIHREALRALFSGSEHELPEILRAFVEGSLQRTVGRALPLGSALLGCLEDLHACPLEGRRRRLFLQSKAIEIVCQAIEALERAGGLAPAPTTMLTARGVLKAQRLLAETFVSRSSVEDLAREVGLSRSALCTGFRQILGQSVFDYTQNLRMEQALAYLNERDASITEIAFAVGYKNVSSFSVAVQRHFGATPTELRRRSVSQPG